MISPEKTRENTENTGLKYRAKQVRCNKYFHTASAKERPQERNRRGDLPGQQK